MFFEKKIVKRFVGSCRYSAAAFSVPPLWRVPGRIIYGLEPCSATGLAVMGLSVAKFTYVCVLVVRVLVILARWCRATSSFFLFGNLSLCK